MAAMIAVLVAMALKDGSRYELDRLRRMPRRGDRQLLRLRPANRAR